MGFQAGQPVLASTAPGWVGESQRTSPSGTVTTTETVVQSITFTAVAGVRYKVTAVQSLQGDTAATSGIMRLRWAAGTSVTTSGTQADSKIIPFFTAGLGFLATLVATFTPATTGNVTVGVTASRNIGTPSISSFGSATQINTILVERV